MGTPESKSGLDWDTSTFFSRENPDTPPRLSEADEATCDKVVATAARDPAMIRTFSMLDILDAAFGEK